MEYSKQQEGTNCTVTMRGRFTFSDRNMFDQIIQILASGIKQLTLDFSEVEFIDSAGLGMLLLAQDEAEKANATIIMTGAKGHVEKMFKVSRFDDIFVIQ